MQFSAGFQKLFSGCPVDGAVDTAASQQGFVGGIDDGIDLEGGDIS
jgi:hypothetical protein